MVKRLGEHQLADVALYRGARFTKAHQPVELVYTEEYEDEHKARMSVMARSDNEDVREM